MFPSLLKQTSLIVECTTICLDVGEVLNTALGNNSNASEQYAGLGQYTVTANQLTVSDAKCWEFNGPEARTATYGWRPEERRLTLKAVGGDLCSARRLLFTRHTLVKQD